MANHKSALKRIRQSEKRKLYNRYYSKTMRHALRDFRVLTDKKEAEERLPKMISCIDKLLFTKTKLLILNLNVQNKLLLFNTWRISNITRDSNSVYVKQAEFFGL